jgi:hypothetical protein
MGCSLSANLFYGYVWDEVAEGDDLTNGECWEAHVLRRRGHESPWSSFPHPDLGPEMTYERRAALQKAWKEENKAAINQWCELQQFVRDELKCDMSHYGHHDWARPYVYAVASHVSTDCGDGRMDVSWFNLVDCPKYDEALACFLSALGLEKPHPRPRWWLVPYYG